jgi:6-phosphogluconolactonase
VDSTISTFAIDPATGVLQQIGSPLVSARPTGITVHPSGKSAYVINTPCSCSGTIQIFAIDALTGALSGGNTILSVGLNPAAVTLDSDGKFLYVVDFGGVDSTRNAALILPGDITAFAVNEDTGNLTPITGSPYVVAYSADGVSVEPSGKFLYLTIRGDVGNHYPDAISVFSIDPKTGQLNIPETMTFSPPGQGPSSIVVTGAIQ